MDGVPIVSQIKSAVQASHGDLDGANKTQENFLIFCPVFSQAASLLEATAHHNVPAARERQVQFLKGVEATVETIPIIGHIKGAYHYAAGEIEKADSVQKSATRTVGVLAGGIAGLATGGPVGAFLGGIVGGVAMDGTYTLTESKNAHEYRPNGSLAYLEAIQSEHGKKPVAGLIVDLVGNVLLDGLSGTAVSSYGATTAGSGSVIRKLGKVRAVPVGVVISEGSWKVPESAADNEELDLLQTVAVGHRADHIQRSRSFQEIYFAGGFIRKAVSGEVEISSEDECYTKEDFFRLKRTMSEPIIARKKMG